MLKKMISSEFAKFNLNNFEFMNKDDANQSDGEPTEMAEEPKRCIYRDTSSGFCVIRFVAGNTYFGQLNEKGEPHGDGTVIIYDPDNPQVTLHQTEGQWENGNLEIESQVFRVVTEHKTPGIFVGIEEGNNLKGIFYEPNGQNTNAEIDNQGNITFSY